MRKSTRPEEMDRISKMRTHYNKCLVKDIKHEQLHGRQPKQFFIFIVNLILLKFCVFE